MIYNSFYNRNISLWDMIKIEYVQMEVTYYFNKNQ